jgi:acylphosphatase
VLGCVSAEAAREVYLAAYSAGWTGLGSIVALPLAQFKRWVESGDTGRELQEPAGPAGGGKKAEAEAAPEGDGQDEIIRRESCPHCLARLERGDDGHCNQCGEPWPEEKTANTYHMQGDVQGVHLRKTLHKILDKYHAGGLAYNNAKTDDVYATIAADPETEAKVLADFRAAMAINPRVHQYAVEPTAKKEKLRHVALADKDLERMFNREGFTSYLGYEHDPAAYRRHWVSARYRLQEDPTTHALSGDVPDLAYRQLRGLEPVYGSQVQHPEQFGLQHWMHGHIPPPPVNPPAELEIPTPDLGEKSASPERWLPRILWIKRAADDKDDRPYTVAVDLDGTLAEAEEPFNAKTIGPVRTKAREWVKAFKDAGARIIIFTVRGDDKLVEAWLKENDVPYDFINENPDQPPGSSGKIISDCYWDDRAYNAKDPDEFGPAILAAVQGEEDEKKPTVTIEKVTIRILLAPDEILENLLDDES